MPDNCGDDERTRLPSTAWNPDNIGLRRHRVGLERVQRIHLGLDDEPMEFNTGTIAQMLLEVADHCDDGEAFTIRGVVNALLGVDENHVLTLQQRKRGKFVSPTESSAKHNRNQKWLHWLAHREREGIKTEAAVAEIAEVEGASRATVFAGIKAAEGFLQRGQSMFPESPNFQNPRPNPAIKRIT